MRRVGRIDQLDPKALLLKIVQRKVQVLADDLAFAQAFFAGFLAGAFFPAGLVSALAGEALRPGSSFSGLAGFGLSLAFSTGPLAGSSG